MISTITEHGFGYSALILPYKKMTYLEKMMLKRIILRAW